MCFFLIFTFLLVIFQLLRLYRRTSTGISDHSWRWSFIPATSILKLTKGQVIFPVFKFWRTSWSQWGRDSIFVSRLRFLYVVVKHQHYLSRCDENNFELFVDSPIWRQVKYKSIYKSPIDRIILYNINFSFFFFYSG